MFSHELIGKIVTLRFLESAYFQPYHDMFSPKVRTIIGLSPNASFDETKSFLKKKVEEIKQNKILFYVIFDNKDKKLIGSIEIRERGYPNGQLGAWIHENYWGGERYQEALDLLLQEYFSKKDENIIDAHIKKPNIRSIKAHKKFGFSIIDEYKKDATEFYILIIKKTDIKK